MHILFHGIAWTMCRPGRRRCLLLNPMRYAMEAMLSMRCCNRQPMPCAPTLMLYADTFIQKTKKLYLDTRTQRNLAKLTDELGEVHSIMTRNIQEVLGQGEKLDSEYGWWQRGLGGRTASMTCGARVAHRGGNLRSGQGRDGAGVERNEGGRSRGAGKGAASVLLAHAGILVGVIALEPHFTCTLFRSPADAGACMPQRRVHSLQPPPAWRSHAKCEPAHVCVLRTCIITCPWLCTLHVLHSFPRVCATADMSRLSSALASESKQYSSRAKDLHRQVRLQGMALLHCHPHCFLVAGRHM